MGKPSFLAAILVMIIAVDASAAVPIYSSRLIHRFSDEARSLWGGETTSWPEKKSLGRMRVMLESDLKRQRLKLGTQNQLLAASEGGRSYNYGNGMGWLHYAWIEIGTPNNSFLVALDTGSDMLWVPCDCIECAPLSLSYYNMLVLPFVTGASIMQDKELGEYSPAHSNTSKHVPCSHELCEKGPRCETPKGHCPYSALYLSDDTSSSGFLFEDQLHLAGVEGNKRQSSAVIVGCGSKQTGAYLEGIAPDGVMGLGPGDISVVSLLAKSGLIPHSFSFCYDKSHSGRLYFGDQGHASQRSTPFLQSNGDRTSYFVEVESYCVGSSCLKESGYKAQVDTGSSFTYLPSAIYDQVVSEFRRQANSTRFTVQEFDNCYKARSLDTNFPSMKIIFTTNQSFEVDDPMFQITDERGDFDCLGMHRTSGDFGIIGQNFMMGYRLVFDWEKMKLGWTASTCEDIGASGDGYHHLPPSPSDVSSNPLPTNEQQQSPRGHAAAPAIAGRATPKPSAASSYRYECFTTSFSMFLWIGFITCII